MRCDGMLKGVAATRRHRARKSPSCHRESQDQCDTLHFCLATRLAFDRRTHSEKETSNDDACPSLQSGGDAPGVVLEIAMAIHVRPSNTTTPFQRR